MKQVALAVARLVFGLFYTAIGLFGAHEMLTNPDAAWPAYNEAEKELVAAMTSAGFFAPVVILTCLVGGTATVFKRTAPVGLLVLTPLIAMIFLYHAYLTGAYVHAGVQAAYLAVLYWLHRDAFIPLWNYGRRVAA